MSPHFPFRLENIFTKSKEIDIIGLKCTQTSSVTKSCDSQRHQFCTLAFVPIRKIK